MLHLYLIKNKATRFFVGFAEYLLLCFILNVPWLAYVNSFLPLPEKLHNSLIIIAFILSAMLSAQHIPHSTKEKIAEYEKNRKPFIRHILRYIVNGLVFSLLLILFILRRKAFDTWVWGIAAMMTLIHAAVGAAFYLADKAICSRLKQAEE